MNILLISSSARGHAVAEAFARSDDAPDIIAISPQRNPGIGAIAAEQHVLDIMDFSAILDIAKRTEPAFAFIGPEDPIGEGLADALEAIDVPCVAPLQKLSQIESSKGFTRRLLAAYGMDDACPRFKVFSGYDDSGMEQFIESLEGEYVVKYDGLKGGKGVKLSGEHLASVEEGIAYANACIRECGSVVIEEKLIGVEFSILSFVSGEKVVHMPAVQDHKRAFEGDSGPNTGGMGTYTDADHSLPFLTSFEKENAEEINVQVAEALKRECDADYKGILYGGFIATKYGVKVIEYNARFGDPEALNILPLLTSDFTQICKAITDGTLHPSMVSFEKKATVCKYIVPAGYPENKEQRGQEVIFPDVPENARVYCGDMSRDDGGTLRLGGSRAAGIVGIADTIAQAEKIAQDLCEKVQGPVRFRSDIGKEDVIKQRIDTMNELRAR